MPAAIEPDSPDALTTIRTAPLTFGSWGTLKRLYKELEAEPSLSSDRRDALAALISRFDAALLVQNRDVPLAQITRGGRSSGWEGFAVQNGRGIFVGSNTIQTADFNVPDRLKPRLGDPLKSKAWKEVVWAGPMLAVVRAQDEQIQIVDVSDFDKPVFRGKLGGKSLGLIANNALANLASIAGGDGVVFAACNSKMVAPFQVISLANPDTPQVVGTLDIPGASFICIVPGTSLVAVLGTGSPPENLLSSLLSQVGIRTQKADAGYLYLVDVSRPTQPVLVSTLAINHDNVLAATEQYVYVADKTNRNRYTGDHGINIISIENPASPRLVARVPLQTYYGIKSIACYENFVYAAPEYNTVKVIDVREPQKPTLLRDITSSYAARVARDGDTLYALAYQGPQLLHLSEGGGGAPSAYGTPPSLQTMAYMKRRARRYLHQLAKTDPAQFATVAARYLSEPGSQTFDPAFQWVTTDLVFGGGGRFVQASHGRGPYQAKSPRGLSIRRREERFPEIWDAHPDAAATLFTAKDAVWPAREMALRILRAARTPIPTLDGNVLKNLLDTPSLLLVAEGVRQAVTRAEAGKELGASTAAIAVAKASAKPRRRLLRAFAADPQKNAQWSQKFAEALLSHLPDVNDEKLSRRDASLAALFAQLFPAQITGKVLVRLAPLLLNSNNPDVYGVVLEAAKREGAGDLHGWLRVLARISEAGGREALLSALAESVQNQTLDESFYNQILWVSPQSAALWRLIRASEVNVYALNSLWVTLLSDPAYENVLRTAMQSSDALALLGQAAISDTEMAGYLEARPEIVDLLTPEAFARLTQTLPASLTLRLAAAASDTVWPRLREGWLRNLREGVGLLELWQSAEAALKTDATGNLEIRLLDDADVSATFLQVDDVTAMLELREPALGPLLGAYFAQYQEKIAGNDALFLQAATHPLPEVRTPALALLPARVIGLPLALGLLESEVPASVEAGRTWFESDALPLLDRALALCDSPAASVRFIGREFVHAHKGDLPLDELSASLVEHADPQMQAFVAHLLGNVPAPQFDREILRTRYQSRQAKEAVKARQGNQTRENSVDVETLLALARGSSTPRDADWALGQLVRRALAGEAIEGLVVEGVTK